MLKYIYLNLMSSVSSHCRLSSSVYAPRIYIEENTFQIQGIISTCFLTQFLMVVCYLIFCFIEWIELNGGIFYLFVVCKKLKALYLNFCSPLISYRLILFDLVLFLVILLAFIKVYLKTLNILMDCF